MSRQQLLWRRSGRRLGLIFYFVCAFAGGMRAFMHNLLCAFLDLVSGLFGRLTGGMSSIFGVLFDTAIALGKAHGSKTEGHQQYGCESQFHMSSIRFPQPAGELPDGQFA